VIAERVPPAEQDAERASLKAARDLGLRRPDLTVMEEADHLARVHRLRSRHDPRLRLYVT
jgi:hypothetical protein